MSPTAGDPRSADLAAIAVCVEAGVAGRQLGDEDVDAVEVEEFLYGHPDIVDVQVIGVPDVRYGEELMAWVQLREGASLSQADVAAYCKGRIAHYKVPRYLHVTDAFPMTVTGKVQKFLMREAAIELLGLQDAANQTTA